MMGNDKRTGKPYIDKDFGHGTVCTSLSCIKLNMSDLAEAGILDFLGIDPANGEPLYKLHEEPS
jgi:hypothetical protein